MLVKKPLWMIRLPAPTVELESPGDVPAALSEPIARNTFSSADFNAAGVVAAKKSPPLVSAPRKVSLIRLPEGILCASKSPR